MKWPRSRGAHLGIALLTSLFVSIITFVVVNQVEFQRLVREYPRDGQDGLGAMMVAFEASAFTLIGVFPVVYFLQRALARRS